MLPLERENLVLRHAIMALLKIHKPEFVGIFEIGIDLDSIDSSPLIDVDYSARTKTFFVEIEIPDSDGKTIVERSVKEAWDMFKVAHPDS